MKEEEEPTVELVRDVLFGLKGLDLLDLMGCNMVRQSFWLQEGFF